jgi:hypothetical protein
MQPAWLAAPHGGPVAVAVVVLGERSRGRRLADRLQVLPREPSRDEGEEVHVADGGVIGMDRRQKLDGAAPKPILQVYL